MDGEIKVKSTPGKGSTFTISFKKLKVNDRSFNVSEEAGFEFDSIWFDQQVVMIVDDIETNRMLVKSMLSDLNLILVEAQNGLEAVKMAKVYQPDVVFMDIRMPVMDGYEATRQIKESPELKRTAIVALTASTLEMSQTNRKDSPFDGFLHKPVVFEDVLGELIRFIDFTSKGLAEAQKAQPKPKSPKRAPKKKG
jgi:CheY-like chemotaxis protein